MKKSSYIHLLVSFLLMIVLGHLPPVTPITQLGMQLLGVFIGSVYAWITLSVLWPSLMGMFAIFLYGIMTPTEFFNVSFGNEVVVFLLFIFVFTGVVEEVGLTRQITNYLLSLSIVKKSPWILIFILFCISFLCRL